MNYWAYESFEQFVDIYAMLLVLPKNIGEIQDFIQFANEINCPDRKGYILVWLNFIGSQFGLHLINSNITENTIISFQLAKSGWKRRAVVWWSWDGAICLVTSKREFRSEWREWWILTAIHWYSFSCRTGSNCGERLQIVTFYASIYFNIESKNPSIICKTYNGSIYMIFNPKYFQTNIAWLRI